MIVLLKFLTPTCSCLWPLSGPDADLDAHNSDCHEDHTLFKVALYHLEIHAIPLSTGFQTKEKVYTQILQCFMATFDLDSRWRQFTVRRYSNNLCRKLDNGRSAKTTSFRRLRMNRRRKSNQESRSKRILRGLWFITCRLSNINQRCNKVQRQLQDERSCSQAK